MRASQARTCWPWHLMQDQKLGFPEAVHMLSPGAEGLKIFHGLHPVLSRMGAARVTGVAMSKALDQFGKGPKAAFQAMTLARSLGGSRTSSLLTRRACC
mmetsp:Transcript_48609/g.150420  ORF Transcript_48609/g.150420 Transcript_48609/m.150420 type:complete len:99 (+) Transcript_48609:868-1164(+)